VTLMNHLVSFADSRLRRSLVRLGKQGRSMDVFNAIHMITENDLPFDFVERFKDKLIPGSRGFGYWSWKPEAILMSLQKMNFGDCLVYVDAGCHLNVRGRKRLLEYLEILKEQETGIVAFQASPPSGENSSLLYDGRKLFDQPNCRWIKGDLLDYFGVRNDPSVVNDQAIGAGIILIRKCEQAISVIQEWQQIIYQRFDLLDDTPSASPNLPGFVEHRHDQAIWTMLCLKHGIKTLSAYEYWYPTKDSGYSGKLKPDWDALDEFPIHARRDKDLGFVRNTIEGIKRRIARGLAKVTKWQRLSIRGIAR